MLATLPSELIIAIVGYLDALDTLKLSVVNRRFRSVVNDSTLAQYQIELFATGQTDVHTSKPLGDRLRRLRHYEHLYHTLNLTSGRTLQISSPPGEFLACYFDDGLFTQAYSLEEPSSTSRGRSVVFLDHLQSQVHDGDDHVLSTSSIELEFHLEDLSTLLSHDLLALRRYDLGTNRDDIHLLSISSLGTHPKVRKPSLRFIHEGEPSYMELFGERLGVITDDVDFFHFIVWNWISGNVIVDLEIDAEHCGFGLLPDDYFAIVTSSDEPLAINIYRIYPDPDLPLSPIRVISLQLPPTRPSDFYLRHSMSFFMSNALRSFGGKYPNSQSPFYPSPEDSIIAFELRAPPHSDEIIIDNETRCKMYTLITHWRSLKGLIDGAQNLTSLGVTSSSNGFHVVPWVEWGPSRTRFFGWEAGNSYSQGSVSGHRYSRSVPSEDGQASRKIWSFHPPAVRRYCSSDLHSSRTDEDELSGETSRPRDAPRQLKPTETQAWSAVTSPSTMSADDFFLEHITTSLPYLEYQIRGDFTAQEVWLEHGYMVAHETNQPGALRATLLEFVE